MEWDNDDMHRRAAEPSSETVLSTEHAFEAARRHQQNGERAAAKALYQKILAVTPDHPECHHYLGLIANDEGEPDRALQLLCRAAMLQPDNPAFHATIGLFYQHLGRYYDAENALRRASQLAPGDRKAQFDLGVILQVQKRWPEAVAAYEAALQIDAGYADALNNLGTVRHQQKDLEGAEAAYRKALSLTPDDADLIYNLACLLEERGALEEAGELFRRCLSFESYRAKACLRLGRVRELQGSLQDAEAWYEKAIAAGDDNAKAYFGLASVHRFSQDDPVMQRLQREVEKTPPGENQDSLLSAIAKAHESLGQYDAAFACYSRVMKRRAALEPFDAAGLGDFLAKVRRAFERPKTAGPAESGRPVPIFIIGMSRSGKTLLESLLARNPSVHPAGEIHAWSDGMRAAVSAGGLSDTYPDFMAKAGASLIVEIGRRYREAIAELAPEAGFVVNTLPGNYSGVGLILRSLPDARIIFCRRESALDHCLFVYRKVYKNGNAFSYDLESLGSYYNQYHDMVDHWRSLYGEGILTVVYEDLVRAPEAAATAACSHCGLSPDGLAIDPSEFHDEEIGYAEHFRGHLDPLRRVLAQRASC
jgi:tetratricopeptide (TPR) repeat protein